MNKPSTLSDFQSQAPKPQPFTLRQDEQGRRGVWDRAGGRWHTDPKLNLEASEAAKRLPQLQPEPEKKKK